MFQPGAGNRFVTPPFSVTGLLFSQVWASPLDSRLARRLGRIEFAYATDGSLASRCSPPRLAATQLAIGQGVQFQVRLGTQCAELLALVDKECIGADNKRLGSQLDQGLRMPHNRRNTDHELRF